jgi:hypothetical protein
MSENGDLATMPTTAPATERGNGREPSGCSATNCAIFLRHSFDDSIISIIERKPTECTWVADC